MSLDATVNAGLVKAFRNYSSRVHQWAAPLDDQQFWAKPFAYGNSFGHLILHLTGNLNYYIGAQIAQTGYVRHRDLEFTDPNPPSKAEAMARFDATIEMVIATIEKQTAEDWAASYAAVGMPEGASRFDAVMQCAAHIFHHQGQMIYLQREWLKS